MIVESIIHDIMTSHRLSPYWGQPLYGFVSSTPINLTPDGTGVIDCIHAITLCLLVMFYVTKNETDDGMFFSLLVTK